MGRDAFDGRCRASSTEVGFFDFTNRFPALFYVRSTHGMSSLRLVAESEGGKEESKDENAPLVLSLPALELGGFAKTELN